MEKGPPPAPDGGTAQPRPTATRSFDRMSLPAIVAVVLVVLAGTSGTVLLARDAGGPSDSGAPAPAAVVAGGTPSAPPTAPVLPASPSPSAAPATATPAPGASAAPGRVQQPAPPPPISSATPLPAYAGPSPTSLLAGPTPPPAPPDSRVTPDRLAWGFTRLNQSSAKQSVVIVNDGGLPLHVFPAGITGDSSGDFSIASDTCSGSYIAPQQECSIGIVYTARRAGDSTAELIVRDDTGGSPSGTPTKTSAVPLTGTGG